MSEDLHSRTRRLIAEQLGEMKAPCVACSFGKDAMVLLHFVRELAPDVPVIYCPHFDAEVKHDFVAKMVRDWNLNIVPFLPKYRDFYGKGQHVELLDIYELAPERYLVLPVEAQPILKEGATLICGMDALNKPTAPSLPVFDGVFIGQKRADVDVVAGRLEGTREVVEFPGFRYICPLAEWTDADIWTAIRQYDIPYNRERYDNGSTLHNNDLWNLCTACIGSKHSVHCPKIDAEVPGMAGWVDLPTRTRQVASAMVNMKGQK